ncbi:MAG: tRNA uridine-5-carboxymethylaminomethyl(34) synthesis enzyme MnmG [Clostridia bacterium]|nr:tRNA uridine-5-carboxymethylaminomethyl(34) synthesis enzyme MnmG [Clostridia bacterium]MBN2883646.1 tRNA uridine-5-carboxymethylaminomethyl(34) synthesis enzyme MnmG [Clostridia bacterium]
MIYNAGKYDIAIIGAGHAGCEAALAAARLGCTAVIFTLNMDSVANMPCNPSIGGTAKGHLVREIDALGGEMGKAADATLIQSRMLNKAKGPAVHSLRAQIDRRAYQEEMKQRLESQENLDLKQAEVTRIIFENGEVKGVETHTGARYECCCAIICSGTYLRGRIIIGDVNYPGGPDGMFPANELSASLIKEGISLMRFKTGTPSRVHKDSLDYSLMEEQKGDEPIVPFSFETKGIEIEQESCFLTYTNEETHGVIRENLHRSPLFSGDIDGVGPRYCPSIEDKVVRFSDKPRHQIFIEPMGRKTREMYVQGMSSSLPEDVQEKMLRTIKGLENVRTMRSAYAIEYDCIDPLQLKPSLEFKEKPGLFSAGQSNGSSGYEEAGAQGLIAGINAAMKIKNREPLVLKRSEAYTGVLIDDLVTKGTNEPYRMMTSRSEYRLLLRQDNADIRLTDKGHEVGLINEERYRDFLQKKEFIKKELDRLKKKVYKPTEVNPLLTEQGQDEVVSGITAEAVLKRPGITYDMLRGIDDDMPKGNNSTDEAIEVECKYEGYLKKQIQLVERFEKNEGLKLNPDLEYAKINGLRIEARQKLDKIKPLSVGQASRISGVSPSDINVLLIYLEQKRRGLNE